MLIHLCKEKKSPYCLQMLSQCPHDYGVSVRPSMKTEKDTTQGNLSFQK